MEIECHQDMIANEHIRIGSNSYEKVKILKIDISKFYSGGLIAENPCYYSVQTLLSSRLLF